MRFRVDMPWHADLSFVGFFKFDEMAEPNVHKPWVIGFFWNQVDGASEELVSGFGHFFLRGKGFDVLEQGIPKLRGLWVCI